MSEVPPVVRPRPRRRRGGGRMLAAGTVLAVLAAGLGVAGMVLGPRTGPVEPSPSGPAPADAVLSARRVPAWTTRPVAARNAAAAVAPVLARSAPRTCVLVQDGSTTLVAAAVDEPLVPASTMKVLTAAAALDLLGAGTRLVTSVTATAAPGPDGTVTGDLVLVGGGDPVLTTATYGADRPDTPSPRSSLEALADRVVAAGVRRVTGSVVGDGTRYDGATTVEGWPERFVANGQVANLSALVVNDGWTVDPLDPRATRDPGPAPDPAAHAAAVLTRLLQARGVQVGGWPRSGPAPPGSTPVAELPSPSVAELVGGVLAFSDNTTAELLVKEIGRARANEGSTAAGVAAIRAWAAEEGLPLEGLVQADGSGLSDANRMTCRLLVALLQRAGPESPLAAGLARPGRPGTLRQRMTEPDLRDRVQAKTGSLNTVRSLAGWLTTGAGIPLEFAVVSNTGERLADAADEALQAELLRALLAYPQTPPPDQVGPRPVQRR